MDQRKGWRVLRETPTCGGRLRGSHRNTIVEEALLRMRATKRHNRLEALIDDGR